MAMTSISLLCTVKDGKLKVFDREELTQGLRAFGDGQELELTIAEVKRKKTRAQEQFFHGPVLKAFEDLGYRKQEAKDMLCLMFIPHEVKQPDGTIVQVPGHTSGLTIKEYNDLIDACMQLAAEQGIYIMDGSEWREKRQREAVA